MQKSMIRLPRKQKASGNRERISPSLARPLWNGCFSVSWGRTGLDLIPSLSLSLALSFRYCRSLSPSLRFGRRRSAPLPFPSPSLPPPPRSPPSRPRARGPPPPWVVWAQRATSGRCGRERPPAVPPLPPGGGRKREKEPHPSPHSSPAAANPISAPEIITSATDARLFQPLQGVGVAAGAGGTGGPGSPKAPASQTDSQSTLGLGGGSGRRAAPRGSRRPGKSRPGTEARSFQN